ncbi:sucrose-phosphatase 2-like [Asparagus officinalis]|uniref:sucrose-phosphatase 2-like n=1 Tax=Asparagus officinalis TaxID=4686 RepID=UPI00098E1995|nr:sucrose-phosphatase 2-like [Asparagus officinalis]
MDRLAAPARLMIVSDLDNTMVDHDDPNNLSLLRFDALWESSYRHDSLLVFSTGRSPAMYKELRKEKPLLTPDITIMSVGTEIAYGETMVVDEEWERFLDQKWDRDVVIEETSKFPELLFQSATEQRPHKVSFFIEKRKAEGVIQSLYERLGKQGLDVKIIYSSGTAIDVLPQGAGKGQALAYLLKRFKSDGKTPVNTLVCGDSGNDAELFIVPDVHGVIVSNAQEELLQWYKEIGKNNLKIIHATERCAAGIIEGIGHFKLGPNMSPRDVVDLSTFKLETFNPGHEVVMFYLLYERWRRAELENSKLIIENMKRITYHSGIIVHPSGVECRLHECIDTFAHYYGDRKGSQFQVWVDRVSSSQIGSDTWLVKFDKWEQSDEGPQSCIVTALLHSKPETPEGFALVHAHQTWMDGFAARDKSSCIF